MDTKHDTVRRRVVVGWGATALAGVTATGRARGQTLPSEVRIGFQKGAAILVLARKQQLIEQRLKKLGVNTVRWVEFQFGPPMLEAMGAGAVDLGSVGDTPPIFAQAGGANLAYVAASPSAQHAVLVPADSTVKTLAELKGRRVAFAKGSSAQNVAIKALAIAGLTLKDIEPLYLAPADATAAFNGGKVDAWVVWDPFYAIAEQHYKARVVADTTDRRLASASYYLASREFADKHPKVLAEVLDEFGKLTVSAGQRREELAAVAAEATGIDAKTWVIAFNRAEFTLGPVTSAHLAQQQQLADTFFQLGIIPRRINVVDYLWQAPKT